MLRTRRTSHLLVGGAPQPSEIMDRNLNFPDGIGVLE
jgi:hypothetical protein